MIISRTPFRVSFFGGGTDYPAWYRENGGAVISTTIDKYCYISCRYLPPFFEHKHRIVYSVIENVTDVAQIKHPSVKAVLSSIDAVRGLEIHHDGDLPARSGLGSSSAFTVGLLNALSALREESASRERLARAAIHIEQNVIKEAVGSQDQIAAAFGGFNRIDFRSDDGFEISPLIIEEERRKEFQASLMLVYTGRTRLSTDIAQTKLDNFKNRKSELATIQSIVDDAMAVLMSKVRPLEDVGKLLHETWKLKRVLSAAVSSPELDQIYETAMKAGASGGKILGAGGGGFMLFFVRPELQDRVRESLKGLLHVSFRFEDSGSRIVLDTRL